MGWGFGLGLGLGLGLGVRVRVRGKVRVRVCEHHPLLRRRAERRALLEQLLVAAREHELVDGGLAVELVEAGALHLQARAERRRLLLGLGLG